MCASHSGEPTHVAAARSILKKAGIPEAALRCGALAPLGAAALEALCRAGEEILPIHNNCSGKHAGFLAACKLRGWELATYLEPTHPLQIAIRAELCHFAEVSEGGLVFGIDGCGAPNYAMPLLAMARAFKNLALPQADAAREAARTAMLRALADAPFYIGGTGRYCSELCAACPQLVGKLGAEGVYVVSILEKKWGLAVKVECGALGPQYNVVQAILEGAGLMPAEAAAALAAFTCTPIRTVAGEVVGLRQAVKEIREGVERAVAAAAAAASS